jgi:CelD/BcsL family acetyltransferase involved in cellulose biosynthesis
MVSVTLETLESLSALRNSDTGLQWASPFVLPSWMKVWWQHFGSGFEMYLAAVRNGSGVIGVAPLKVQGDTASFLGSENVCDYADLVSAPGLDTDFFASIIDSLKRHGVKRLDLGLLRPDSLVVTRFAAFAAAGGASVSTVPEDVSAEMDLPGTFDAYLEMLNTKQRHEVRRKIRRLEEAGKTDYQLVNGDAGALDSFMGLFALARGEKANFMTPEMEAFFRDLAAEMSGAGLLRLGKLDFDGKPVAMIMAFDYNDSVYLYNSGFDPQYDSLSVGLLSKVFCIRESIRQGKKRFEFLKGNEIYKQRLGGKEIPLYRCQIAIA